MESMSSYARQFVHQMRKPEVDHIHGMPQRWLFGKELFVAQKSLPSDQ